MGAVLYPGASDPDAFARHVRRPAGGGFDLEQPWTIIAVDVWDFGQPTGAALLAAARSWPVYPTDDYHESTEPDGTPHASGVLLLCVPSSAATIVVSDALAPTDLLYEVVTLTEPDRVDGVRQPAMMVRLAGLFDAAKAKPRPGQGRPLGGQLEFSLTRLSRVIGAAMADGVDPGVAVDTFIVLWGRDYNVDQDDLVTAAVSVCH